MYTLSFCRNSLCEFTALLCILLLDFNLCFWNYLGAGSVFVLIELIVAAIS